jgi:hypothetical protein
MAPRKTSDAQDITNVRPSGLMEILKGLYKAKSPKPIILGSPGCGKTSIAYELADEVLKIPRWTFQATLYDPVEVKGLPVFDHVKNTARFLPFEDMPSQGKGILVVDDMPHAATQTQNAFMRLILEGIAGAWELGDIWPVATGNRATDRAGAKDLQTSMANRFCFLYLVADYGDWRPWAIRHDIVPEVISYLGTPMGQDYLDRFDPSQQVNATPRSWEFASNIMRQLRGNLMKTAMFGCIGEEATLKFTGWLKYYEKMPDLKEIVGGKNIFPEELDVMYATVSGLVALTKDFPKKQTIVQRLIDYSVAMPDKFVELGALLSKDLLTVVGQDVFVHSNLDKWADRYPDLIVGEG